MNKPLVSVIIPCFNCSNTIYKALDSVKIQNYRPIEIILINDCSSDTTWEILEEYNFENLSSKIITNPINKGIWATRNTGIVNASGEYLAFLDSDDEWVNPNKLSMQVNFLKKNMDYWFVCTAWTIKIFWKLQNQCHFQNDQDFRNLVLEKYVWHTSTWLIKKDVIKKSWLFWLHRVEDYEYLLRIGSCTKCWCINKVCAQNNHFSTSDSNKNKIKYYLLALYVCYLYRNKYPFFWRAFYIRIQRWIKYIWKRLL